MHERVAPGGDLHERAKASLSDRAFLDQHMGRLNRAGDEVRAKYPRDQQATDAVHDEAQQAIHVEAMRVHHEQDFIGNNSRLQEVANRERSSAEFRRDDSAKAHANVMAEIGRAHAIATADNQRDRDAQSRGFADAKHEAKHLQAQRDRDSQSRGFANEEAETEHHAAEKAKAERAAEDKAIAAGHVSSEMRDVVDRYVAGDEARHATAEQHADALDHAHHAAADALAEFHAYHSEDGDFDTSNVIKGEHFNDTQSALHEALGRDEHGGYERDVASREGPQHPDDADLSEDDRYNPYGHLEQPHPSELGIDPSHENYAFQLKEHEEGKAAAAAPYEHHQGLEYVPHPDHTNEELSADDEELTAEAYKEQLAGHEAWKQRAEAVHAEAVAAHQAEFNRRAEAAQTALEHLHEHQIAAYEHLKGGDKEERKARKEAEKRIDAAASDDEDGSSLVNHDAFAHHERDYGTEDGEPEYESDMRDPQHLVDHRAREDYENAHGAAATMYEHARDRLENHTRFGANDAVEALKSSMRDTRDSIKELGRITGRKPKLPVKAKKGATGRFCSECGRQQHA